MLFPETDLSLLDRGDSRAPRNLTMGCQHGEQALKDQLKESAKRSDDSIYSNSRSWDEIRHRLAIRSGHGYSEFLDKPKPRRDGFSEDDDA